MKIHILGICGTFMAGIALLARARGHEVEGCDTGVYPPMSKELAAAGIPCRDGYLKEHLQPAPDLVIIGNALSRGNRCVEHVLDTGIPFTSGAEWLAANVLGGRHVMAVAGTHGKTTTTALLAWILRDAGVDAGYLVGGVAGGLGPSARTGGDGPFVVEADEYDTAFFDKRSKFIHYRPRTLIITNIEFDHADIFADLAAIRREFQNLIRTVPGTGQLLVRHGDSQIAAVLEAGCWTPVATFGLEDAGADWSARPRAADWSAFEVLRNGEPAGTVAWPLFGAHNAENALAAVAAATRAGLAAEAACTSAGRFPGVERRLQRVGGAGDIVVFDDFAHHPTAIRAALDALRAKSGGKRIVAVLEPRSNTMKRGLHGEALADALAGADAVLMYRPEGLAWRPEAVLSGLGDRCRVLDSTQAVVDGALALARPGDRFLIMSNGGFDNVQNRLVAALQRKWS